MSDETEIERLVVSIVGDLTSLNAAKAEGIETIQEITDANNALKEAMEALGLTAESASQSEEEFTSSVDRSKSAIEAALNSSFDFSPVLNQLQSDFNLTAEQAQFLVEANEVLVETLNQLGPSTEEATAFLADFEVQVAATLASMASQGSMGLDDLIDGIEEAQTNFDSFGTMIQDVMDQQLLDSVEAANSSMDTFIDTLGEANDELVEMNYQTFIEGMEEAQQRIEEGAASLDDLLDVIHDAGTGFGDLNDFVVSISDAMDEQLLDSVEAAHGSLEDFLSVVEEITDELQETNLRAIESASEGMENLDTSAEEATGSLEDLIGGLSAMPGPVGRYTRELMDNVEAQNRIIAASGSMLTSVLGVAAVFTAVVGPIGAVAALLRSASKELEALDATAKKAAALGDTVTDLQGLSFALEEIAGMSSSQTESSLKRLQRSIASAAEGGEAAGKVYKQLGLDLDALKQKTPTKQFEEVAEAVSNYGNATDKALIAQKIFGRGSEEIVIALTAQSDAIKESKQFAEDYGVTITEVQSEALQMANDNWGRVSEAMSGWMRQLSAELAPLLNQIAEMVLDWIPPVSEFRSVISFIVDLSTVILGIYKDVATVLSGIAEILVGIAKVQVFDLSGIENIQSGVGKVAKGLAAESAVEMLVENENIRQSAAKIADEKERQRAAQEAINAELKAEDAKQKQIESQAKNYADELKKRYAFMSQEETGERSRKIFDMMQDNVPPDIIAAAREFEQKIADLEEKRRLEKEAINALAKEGLEISKEIEAAQKRGKALDEQFKSEQEKAIDQAKELKDLFERGLIRPETFEKGINALNEGLNKATQEANQFWIAMNGPGMSEFGFGREGLELDLIKERGLARSAIVQRSGVSSEIADRIGVQTAYREATNPQGVRPSETKLINVLNLLERHLRPGNDPNKIPVGIAQPGDLT